MQPLDVETRPVAEIEKKGKDPHTGRFLKGNTYKPPTAHRPKKEDAALLQDSLREACPPEYIGQKIMEVIELAIEKGHLKVALSGYELILAYQFGKPVARQLTVSSKMDKLLDALREGSDAESMGEIETVLGEVVGLE